MNGDSNNVHRVYEAPWKIIMFLYKTLYVLKCAAIYLIIELFNGIWHCIKKIFSRRNSDDCSRGTYIYESFISLVVMNVVIFLNKYISLMYINIFIIYIAYKCMPP